MTAAERELALAMVDSALVRVTVALGKDVPEDGEPPTSARAALGWYRRTHGGEPAQLSEVLDWYRRTQGAEKAEKMAVLLLGRMVTS